MNKAIKILVCIVLILMGLVGGLGLGLLLRESQPEPKVECLSGFVTIEGIYGQRLVIGDMEICGIDLEMSNITGPSKLYDLGDPL